MLTDTTTTTVACPFCGADASPLHSLADWRRTGATLCEGCGAGCPSRGDYTAIWHSAARIDSAAATADEWAAFFGNRRVIDQYSGNVSVSLDGGPTITVPAISGVATFTADPEFAREYPGVFVEATGTRFEADPVLGGVPAPMRRAAGLFFAAIDGEPTDEWRALNRGERVPQVADAGACEECGGSGSDNGIACVSCRLTGRTDGRRGAGEDYDPGDGSTCAGETQLAPGLTRNWLLFVNGRHERTVNDRDERHRRSIRKTTYTGAPGNHLATLPAGRLVLDARARRIERAGEIHARLFDADAPRDVAAHMAQRSPDLPRAHVSE